MRTRRTNKKMDLIPHSIQNLEQRDKNYQFFHSHNSTFTKEKHLKTIVLFKGIISPSKISKYNKTIVHKYHKVKARCLISSFLCTQIMQKKKMPHFNFSPPGKPLPHSKIWFKKKITSFLFLEAKKLPHSGNLH